MTSKPIDIKSLTSALKDHAKSPKNEKLGSKSKKEKLYNDRSSKGSENRKEINKQENKNDHSDGFNSFMNIIQNVNEKDHYQIDRFIYVDADIHEVFLKLKSQTKLKISHLASYLLEKFINEHKEAIVEIITRKQNKFLD